MYSELLVENSQFEPTTALFGTPAWSDAARISLRFLATERVPGLSYGVVCGIRTAE